MTFVNRKVTLKARRALRKQRRKAEEATGYVDEQFDRQFLRRFSRLQRVRRFVAVWIALVSLMSVGALLQVRGMDGLYLTSVPTSGGTYREGILGTFTNSSPLFAASSVDASVSRLLYSGLFSVSAQGSVIPDLASDYVVDDKGLVYTVTLRGDVFWHDGNQFDADDVVFTYRAIQNPEVRSPLRSSWTGVKVEKVDAATVTFTLPNPLSSFIYGMTNGIVPAHILSEINAADLRSTSFNTIVPVGTGPYILSKLTVLDGENINTRQEQLTFERAKGYHGKKQNIENVVIRTYRDEDRMLQDFQDKAIQSMIGLTSVSETVLKEEDVQAFSTPLTSVVMVFFNMSNPILSDQKVRTALIHATDSASIRNALSYDAIPVDSPFLRNQFPYNKDKVQRGYDVAAANTALDEAGWTARDERGVRVKDGVKLTLRFVSQSLSEYATITQRLQQDWRAIGVEVDAILQPEEDIQLGAIQQHSYDVLLYGISIGYDPDVFAYWHSSQIDPTASSGLNLSEFKSDIADEALESGRTRIDEALRKVKYQPFLDTWVESVPAIALYQPRTLMVVNGTFIGFESGQFRTAVDRYTSMHNWSIRNEQKIKQ